MAAAGAQKLIDVAVQAGANGVENVGRDVADEESLEGQAREAAMQKARKIAGELAKSAGSKLGDLLYAIAGITQSGNVEGGMTRTDPYTAERNGRPKPIKI